MAIIKVMQGDLLKLFKEGSFQAIAHGCNCRNLMGAGIAAQISEQFPEAYAADTEMHKRFRLANFGDHDIVSGMGGQLSVGHTKYGQVYNLYTQIELGRNGSYQLLQMAAENLNKFCKQRSITRIGVPLIGAGIAGLDIIASMTIINACTPDVDVVVVVWTGDDKSWKQASQFYNMSFPRKFNGAIVVRSLRGDALIRKSANIGWKPTKLDASQATFMQHNRTRCITLSNTDPNIYLFIQSQDDFEDIRKDLY